jgi:hypothetical protein
MRIANPASGRHSPGVADRQHSQICREVPPHARLDGHRHAAKKFMARVSALTPLSGATKTFQGVPKAEITAIGSWRYDSGELAQ